MPSIDLSYMGISFRCNYRTVQQVFPGAHWSGRQDNVNLTLSIKMAEDFTLDCDAVVTRFFRLSENEYHVGVQFLGLDDEAQYSLVHYVNNK